MAKKKVIQPAETDVEAALTHLHSPKTIEADPEVLRSPATSTSPELEEVAFSARVSSLVNDISFLRNRMIKDYNQVQLHVAELTKLIPNVDRAEYYFNEGLESINQALEYLKDSEVGDK